MSNPLFQMIMSNSPVGNAMSLLERFNKFRSGYTGNAQEEIQNMLRSGRISQDQYNRAVQLAQQLQYALKR